MILRLSSDRKHWLISYEKDSEREQMVISMNRTIRNTFVLRKKNTKWKGQVNFLINDNKIKLGLWNEVKKICKKHRMNFAIEGLDEVYKKVSYREVESFVIHLTRKYCPQIVPRKDQIDALHKLIVYQNCLADLGTSAGKTFIIFCYCLWKIYHKQTKKMLIICHDADNVLQFAEAFREYGGGKVDMKVGLVYGGTKFKDKDIHKYRIIIGNFQALQHKEDEFFHVFTDVINDEVQKATNKTIQRITQMSINADCKLGLSGTILEDKSADHYTLVQTFGPVVARVSQRELMDSGAATPIKIEVITLNYPDFEDKKNLISLKTKIKTGNAESLQDIDLYHMEMDIIRRYAYRLDLLGNLISKLTGNTLVLFIDVKGGYGRKIVDKVKKFNSKKEVYYIDGDVDVQTRGTFKKRMEEGDNKVLVATYPTYGTGKSIKNIHHIVLAEPMKGFNIIVQVIGRGMRLHDSKDFFTMWDVVDNLSVEPDFYAPDHKYKSILMKQSEERIRLYLKGQHPYKMRVVMMK